jgi:hypothetical protein
MSTVPIPINSPFFDGSGGPNGPAAVALLGNVSRPWLNFLQSNGALATGASSGTGSTSAGSTGAAVGSVTTISVTGIVDPLLGIVTLVISVAPPSDPTFVGCHLYVEIPDQSAGTSYNLGTTGLGSAIGGGFAPIDLGVQPFNANQQPWTLTLPLPVGLNPDLDQPARLYACSYSATVDNPVIQNGQPNASPNQAFTVVSLASGTPTAGENITTVCGTIIGLVLPNDNTTGKLETPILVSVGSVPSTIPGWVCQLVLVWAGNDPTVVANQQTVGNIFSTAGPVLGSPDGIPITHSFAVTTPTTIQTATIFALAGLVDSTGKYKWNNLVPAVTPSCIVQVGTLQGTVDASAAMVNTLATYFSTSGSTFAIVSLPDAVIGTCGINKLIAGTATFNSTVTLQMAAGGPSVVLASTGITLTSGANTTTLTASGGITLANGVQSVNITNAQVKFTDGTNIFILNPTSGSALTGNSLSFSTPSSSLVANGATITIKSGSNEFIATAAHVVMTDGTNTITLAPSSGIVMSTAATSLALTSSLVTLTNGSYVAQISASQISLANGTVGLTLQSGGISMVNGTFSNDLGASSIIMKDTSSGNTLTLNAGGITLLAGANAQLELTAATLVLQVVGATSKITLDNAGNAYFTGTLGTTTLINGNTIQCGLFTCAGSVLGAVGLTLAAGTGFFIGSAVGYTGTLAAAIAAGKSVLGGIIVN